LWVGPESKAAEEKKFFDTHLSPFYRIEQVVSMFCFVCLYSSLLLTVYIIFVHDFLLWQLILATVPDPKSGRAPSIVTDENILLLFDIQQKVF